MDEYISREAAQDEACDRCNRQGHCNRPELCPVMISIKNIPAADVRPVVLCQDCIYAPTGNRDGADLEWPCDDFPERNPCPLKCEDRWYSRKPAPDFFCANGKRK